MTVLVRVHYPRLCVNETLELPARALSYGLVAWLQDREAMLDEFCIIDVAEVNW